MAGWHAILQHARRRTCSSTPVQGDTSLITGPSPDYNLEEASTNWAGVVAVGGGYTQVSATWSFPSVDKKRDQEDVNSWVGLGGDSNDGGGTLVQAGSRAGYDTLNCGYYSDLWYEDLQAPDPRPQRIVFSPAPYAGDTITAEVDQGTLSNDQIYFLVDDLTTGEYFGQYFSWPRSTACGNACTAEWIVERIQPNLANFNGEEFNSDYVIQNGSSESIGQLSTNAVRMWSCWPSGSGCTPASLCYPGPIHNGTLFVDWWQGYS